MKNSAENRHRAIQQKMIEPWGARMCLSPRHSLCRRSSLGDKMQSLGLTNASTGCGITVTQPIHF